MSDVITKVKTMKSKASSTHPRNAEWKVVRSSVLNALYQFKFFLLDSAMTVGFLVQRFPRGLAEGEHRGQ